MKTLLFFITIAMLFAACEKNDPISTQIRTVDPYTGISVQSNIKVTLRHGTTSEVKLTGSTNFLDKIDLSVENNTLIIKRDLGLYTNYNVEIIATTPSISFIESTSSNNIDVENFTLSNDLTLKTTNSGNINTKYLDLKSHRLNVEVAGDGNINAQGAASQADINLTGSGNYHGYQMTIDRSNIHINNSGNAEVNVATELRATINSSGSIYYKGQPNIIQGSSSGDGTIIDAN